MDMRVCKGCGGEKPVNSTNWQLVSPTSKRGMNYPQQVGKPYGKCRDCRRKYTKEYLQDEDNKKHHRELQASYSEDEDVQLLRATNQVLRKRDRKRQVVEEMGGKCSKCGYDKCLGALDFHHPNGDKLMDPSRAKDMRLSLFREEASKCILLCANCHRELHYEEKTAEVEANREYLRTTKYANNKWVKE